MSRRRLTISQRLALVAILPAAIGCGVAAWLSVNELERLHDHERALIGDATQGREPRDAAAADALAAASIDRAVARIAGVGSLCALGGGVLAWLHGRELGRRVRALVERS